MHFDTSFIKKLKDQDHQAFSTFYLQTVEQFSRYIDSHYNLEEDTKQDILSEFYVKFRGICKNIKEEHSFSGFIWSIFKNLIKDYFKKNHEIPFTELNSGEGEEENSFEESLIAEDDVTLFFEQEFALEQIKEALTQLEDMNKDIIYWKFIENKSNEELEIILGISNENVRKRTSRAIQALKSYLNKD